MSEHMFDVKDVSAKYRQLVSEEGLSVSVGQCGELHRDLPANVFASGNRQHHA